MPSPYNFRRGWESEHLAKFILSKFSFVAEPSTISDDLGSDFFCTLFEVEGKKFLRPQNSFAIQIKSKKEMKKNKNKFEITDKRGYLHGLEIPFFVGVADRDNLKLTIYAGEYICDHFSGPYNNPKELHIELIEERDEPLKMEYRDGDKTYIKFPKVVEIEANYKYISNPNKIEDLFNICRMIQENIASKTSKEFIFKKFKSNFVHIYAGPGSSEVFEDNFLKRLAEVFFNLKWLYGVKPRYEAGHEKAIKQAYEESIKKDFEIYKKLYLDLLDRRKGYLPEYLTKVFDELNRLVER